MDDNVKLAKELVSIARELTANQSRVNMWCKEITKHYNGLVEALDQAVAEGASALSEPLKKVKNLQGEIQTAIFKSYKK